MFSRRSAENAKEKNKNCTVFTNKYMTPLRSLRLCESKITMWQALNYKAEFFKESNMSCLSL
jgi:hypothetical protein